MSDAGDGTGAGLLAFLEWAGNRGEINRTTAKAIAVATGKVLAVEADPAGIDVGRLNLEDLFGRFETLNRTNYTSDSLDTYRSRFFKGISMYLAWLDKRPDWKAAGRQQQAGKAVAVRSVNSVRPKRRQASKQSPTAEPASASPDTPDSSITTVPAMVPYDLPLRPGMRVRLVLPELLTQADAKRIAAFVDSLAFGQAEAGQEGA